MPLNEYQKAVIRTHGGGDYAYILDLPTETEQEQTYMNAGDTLFTFFVLELADDSADEPMTREVAVQRLETALQEVECALWQVDKEFPAPPTKSDVVAKLAADLGLPVQELKMANVDPQDLMGFMGIDLPKEGA